MIWTTAWYDVVYQIKLKSDELSTNHLQIYNSLAEIASAIFGGGKKDKPVKINDLSPDQAVDHINSVFAMAGGAM